jgi:ribonuclease VapC
MTDAVLDSSAILANLFGEPGGDIARAAAPTAVISAANLAEVVTKLIVRGMPESEAIEAAHDFRMEIADVDAGLAELAGVLHARTRALGISMGDAFCLALAASLGLPVLTTDRRLRDADPAVEVRLIR